MLNIEQKKEILPILKRLKSMQLERINSETEDDLTLHTLKLIVAFLEDSITKLENDILC